MVSWAAALESLFLYASFPKTEQHIQVTSTLTRSLSCPHYKCERQWDTHIFIGFLLYYL